MSFLRRHSDSIPTPFPQYLQKDIPFRRRKSRHGSSDSCDSTFSSSSIATSTSTNTSISTACTSVSTSNSPFHCTPTPVPTAASTDTSLPPPDGKLLNGHASRIHCAKCSTDLCLSSQIISKGFVGRHGRAYLVQGTPSHIYTQTANLPNTFQTKAVPRNLVTGQHMVSDVSCAICGIVIGWKYVAASEESQRYKVGKYILETRRVRVGVNWENDDDDDAGVAGYDEVFPLHADQLRNLDRPGRGLGGSSTGGGNGGALYSQGRNRSRSQSLNRKSTSRSPSPASRVSINLGAYGSSGDGPANINLDDIEFDSQDEDECEDLFAGVWSPQLAIKRRQRRNNRIMNKQAAIDRYRSRNASEDTLASR